MNLPNYFLADLPAEAVINTGLLTDCCVSLKRNREQYLRGRSTEEIIRVLAEVGSSWLNPEYELRKLALEHGPRQIGFSKQSIEAGLGTLFAEFSAEKLKALVEQELGHVRRLDEVVASEAEDRVRKAALVSGPELLLHIAAGTLPNPAIASLVLGLLARSAVFLKCGSGSSLLPRLFAHSIHEVAPKLGACIEIAEWKGGDSALESVIFSEADCVMATGSDGTLAAIRARLPHDKRFLGYGHRLSFAFVTSEAISGFNAERVISSAAADVAAWDQLGCLSPHVVYVEFGGKIPPEEFASKLARELSRLEEKEPRGVLCPSEAAEIATRRSFYELRAATSDGATKLFRSEESTAWTVVYEVDPLFQVSCLNRFIYVKGVPGLEAVLRGADSIRNKVSTVGLAATENQAVEIVQQLARWGATRICPIGKMQKPPLNWRHDGRPALGDLVRWTDWELS